MGGGEQVYDVRQSEAEWTCSSMGEIYEIAVRTLVEIKMSELIQSHGGYRHLKSFQVSQLVYDITVRFVDRYIDRFSRTQDQMIQAARIA